MAGVTAHTAKSLPLAGFGGPTLCDCQRRETVAAVLAETGPARERIHRVHWDLGRPCDITVTVAGRVVAAAHLGVTHPGRSAGTRAWDECARCGEPAPRSQAGGPALAVTGECPCRDFLLDVLLLAHQFLAAHREDLCSPAAAARRHVRNRQHDYVRACRRERGAQVRSDRIEHSVRARGLATDEQRWLLADIVTEAGSYAPLQGQEQLEHRLAVLRARRVGGDPDDLLDDVRADLRIVAEHCSRGAKVDVGTGPHPEYVTWWEAYVERPLGRRRCPSDVPLAVTEDHMAEDGYSLDLPCPRSEDPLTLVLDRMTVRSSPGDVDSPGRLVLGALRTALTRDPTADREHLITATLRELAAADVTPISTVEAFLGDPLRKAEAVAVLDRAVGPIVPVPALSGHRARRGDMA